MSWIFGYCNSGDVKDLLACEAEYDMDTMDKSADFAEEYRFVSATYPSMSKAELRECIKRDGWWFKDGIEAEEDGFPYGENGEEAD